jgi:hypothetical protein
MKKSELRQIIKEELLKETQLESKFLNTKEAKKISKQMKDIAKQAEYAFGTFAKWNGSEEDVSKSWNNVLRGLVGLDK